MTAGTARGSHLAILILSLSPWLHLVLAAAGALPDPGCPWLALTGGPCPLCGTVRSALALLGGDLRASLALNPLGLGLMVLAATQPPYRLLRTLRPSWSWREELLVTGPGLLWLAAVPAIASLLADAG